MNFEIQYICVDATIKISRYAPSATVFYYWNVTCN